MCEKDVTEKITSECVRKRKTRDKEIEEAKLRVTERINYT